MSRKKDPVPAVPIATLPAIRKPDKPMLITRRVRDALRDCHGSVVLAAHQLNTSVTKLDRYLRMSQKLHGFVKELRQNSSTTSEYRSMTLAEIEQDIKARAILYRSEALDELRKLARMDIGENSALAQVKLLAATRLYQETGAVGGGGPDDLLRRLNDDYHAAAPRIREIRERVVTFEESPFEQSSPPGTGRVIEHQPLPPEQ